MESLLGLFTGSFKTYLIAAIVAAILVVVGVFSWKHKSALESLKQVQEQNIQLEKEKTALSQVNQQNQTFITNMQADLAKKEQIVNDFRSELTRFLFKMQNFKQGALNRVAF